MDSNLYISIILIAGIVQGLFLTIILFTQKRGNRTANIILGVILLLFTIMIIPHAKFKITPHNGGFHNEYIIHMMFFLLPPLLYYYIKVLTGRHSGFSIKDARHFIPFGISFLLIVPLLITDITEYNWHILLNIITAFIAAQVLFYLYYSLRLIKEHRKNIEQNFSHIEKINLNWLRFLLWGQLIVWFLFLLVELIDFEPRHYMWVLLAVFIYLMGYFALKQPEILIGIISGNGKKEIKKKYAKSALTPEMSDSYYNRLIKIMEEKQPYLRENLTLQSLANLLSVPGYHLSQVINERLNQNFFEFINGYRIEEAKKLLAASEKDNYSIAAIGYEAGFSSVSSFNTVFKKAMNMTPSEYKKSCSKTNTPG
ncbi:MAG: helix-turn-helix domain-containing protein [Ignavibacteriaceae bacterium]